MFDIVHVKKDIINHHQGFVLMTLLIVIAFQGCLGSKDEKAIKMEPWMEF